MAKKKNAKACKDLETTIDVLTGVKNTLIEIDKKNRRGFSNYAMLIMILEREIERLQGVHDTFC